MVGYGHVKLVRHLRAWIASVSVASLVLGTMVGVAAVGALVLGGAAAPAHADPPPSDPPTSITLASNETSFTAGSSATLTATTDVDVSDSASTITITDTTTSTTLATCTSGTTCTASVTFYTGGAHTYVATVNDLTSNTVTVSREGWTVTLASSETSFSAGESFTLTTTANQDVGNTNGNYYLRIFDKTARTSLATCTSGTTCSVSTQFYAGAAHTYEAEVSAGDYYAVPGSTTDVQGTSNDVAVSRDTWTLALTSDKVTLNAGDSVTLTATANQNVGNTNSAYEIFILDNTAHTILASCYSGATCTVSTQFYTGAAHTYSAEVSSNPSNVYGSSTDVQIASNSITVTRAIWTVALATSETTFAAGDSVTLTATANQNVGSTNGNYEIDIFDMTTGTMLTVCNTGTTCTVPTQFYSGAPHTYKADVSAGPGWGSYAALTDVQATSDVVTETREPWTVALTENKTVFASGDSVELTATANQNVGGSYGSYEIDIFDVTTGAMLTVCYSGATCAVAAAFSTGGAHTYIALVSAGPAWQPYGASTDVQTTSNEVSASRELWTISMTSTSSYSPPPYSWYPPSYATINLTFHTVANQTVGEATNGEYDTYIVDYTTGQVLQNCNTGTTCTVTASHYIDQPADSYVAFISTEQGDTFNPAADIQASSDGYSAATGVGATLPDELTGGKNASENAPCPCKGDPVSSETGEFFEPSTDIGIPGVGPALSITRTYSSTSAAADGPFGYGWAAGFSASLSVLTVGDSSDPLPREVQITQENGATDAFAENWDQTYTPAARVQATLTHDATTGNWTFTRQLTQIMVFNASGQLIAEKDLNGNTVSIGYNTDGQVDSLTGSGSRSISLSWTDGHVSEAEDSAGRIVTYNYNTAGDLISEEGVDGAIRLYGYDSSHDLTTLDSPNGGETTNTYDSSGRVTAQTDPIGRESTWSYSGTTTTQTAPDGSVTVDLYGVGLLQSETKASGTSYAETTSYTYDSSSNIASITDPLGKITSYTYDANGDELTTTDPLSRTTTSTYDSLGDPLTVIDPLSRQTTATYDSAGDKLSATSPSGRVQHWTYNTNGTLATAEDARGETTTYGYNSAGDQTSATDPDGRETSTAFNSAGFTTSATDPGGNATTYTTDPAGRVLTSTDPNSHTTTWTYDADGNKTSAENADGHTTTYAYDLADELTSSTVPGSHTTTYTYTDAGLPASDTDPNGHVTSKAYNALELVTSSTNGDGQVTNYGYDGDGRQTSVSLPSGDESTVTYDDAGQKTSSTDAAGKTTTYAYDNDGELTSTTDPLSRVTSQSYTADGQVHVATLPDSSTETSTFNADGQLTDFENADGANTTYSYDNAGLLTSKTEPGSITTSYTYTTAGQLHVTTNPDSTTVADSYNAGGSLIGVAYSSSSAADVSYSYDADNQRTAMTDATGTSSYSYNSRDLMTSETNGAGQTIGYGYDNANQFSSLTYPGDKTVTYGYDDAGQMTSLTDSASDETTFTWSADGQLATQADPNGITQTRSYDADDRTTDISTANSSSTLADYTYGYDNAGDLTSGSTIDPNNSTAVATDYGYNSLGQLATVDNGTTSAAYANTPAGSITENTAGSTLAYNSAEELTSLTPGAGPSTTYGYDDNGGRTSSTVGATETTSASTTTYGYDPAGNLASVGIPATGSSSAESVDYTSDGDGLRQSRTGGTSTANFLWDTNGSLPLMLDDGTYSYLYGPSSAPIAEINDSTGAIRYLTADLIGSTRLITAGTGAVVGVNIYDEYGNVTSHTGTATSPFGYSGNWTDPVTALVFLRARDYDPDTAQFITVDPLIETTQQPYAYAYNDPLERSDPSGLRGVRTGVGSDGSDPDFGELLSEHALASSWCASGGAEAWIKAKTGNDPLDEIDNLSGAFQDGILGATDKANSTDWNALYDDSNYSSDLANSIYDLFYGSSKLTRVGGFVGVVGAGVQLAKSEVFQMQLGYVRSLISTTWSNVVGRTAPNPAPTEAAGAAEETSTATASEVVPAAAGDATVAAEDAQLASATALEASPIG
jgi:RHS repeat-associated protein